MIFAYHLFAQYLTWMLRNNEDVTLDLEYCLPVCLLVV